MKNCRTGSVTSAKLAINGFQMKENSMTKMNETMDRLWRLYRQFILMVAAVALFMPIPSYAGDTASAMLQGLDKVTARISTFKAGIGREVSFGALRIKVLKCNKPPPEAPPNSAAFVEIYETKTDKSTSVKWFSGWIFANSPALNALEHPVYDIWLKDCE